MKHHKYRIHTQIVDGLRITMRKTKNNQPYQATIYLFATEAHEHYNFETEAQQTAWFQGFKAAITLADDDAKITEE